MAQIIIYYKGEKSKATKKEGINKNKPTDIGNKCNQHNFINWSYLNLGKVARTKTNKKQNKQVFNPKKIDSRLKKELFSINSGKL